MLSPEEFNRYQRHISLAEIGISGQLKLKEAKVLVVGAGGLGTPILQYLAAAGIGVIGMIDGDRVDLSNLQRQILYSKSEVGKLKVEVAAEKLKALNEEVEFMLFKEYLTQDNVFDVLKEFDIVVDGTDNFETRMLLGDATLILNKPLVYGSIYKFEGQVTVFNFGEGPSLRCLFPDKPKKTDRPNCNEVGVLGVLPGLIGLQMASEVMKILLDIGTVLKGQLFVTNILNNTRSILKVARIEENFKRVELEDDYSLH